MFPVFNIVTQINNMLRLVLMIWLGTGTQETFLMKMLSCALENC